MSVNAFDKHMVTPEVEQMITSSYYWHFSDFIIGPQCRWSLTVSLSLSHWYPRSGVVLDCIDS